MIEDTPEATLIYQSAIFIDNTNAIDQSIEIKVEDHFMEDSQESEVEGSELSIETQFQGPIDPNKTLLLCNICPYQTTDNNYLEVHKKTHRTKYNCDLCSYFTCSLSKIQRHKTTKHTKKEDLLYYCGDCEFTTLKRKDLRTHIKKEHKPTKHSCEKCPYKCMSELALINHVNKHHSMEAKCKFCPRDYPNKEKKQVHELRHLFIRYFKHNSFKCKRCEFRTSNFEEILIHCKGSHSLMVDFDVSNIDLNRMYKM